MASPGDDLAAPLLAEPPLLGEPRLHEQPPPLGGIARCAARLHGEPSPLG